MIIISKCVHVNNNCVLFNFNQACYNVLYIGGGFVPGFYDRIEELLQKKGLSKRQLAIKAGVPYQTVISAFRRKSEGFSLEYKTKIAEALEVNLSDLYGFQIDPEKERTLALEVKAIEKQEKKLLQSFRKLNSDGQKKVIDYITDLSEIPKYQEPIEQE